MDFAVSSRVVSQNRMGRFIAACDHAATETVKQLIEEGAALSREMAPVGSKVDKRTIPLAQSIETKMVSSTQGVWFSTARHALPQEFGAVRHDIPGYVHFWWENAMPDPRWWEPGDNTIDHPGNPPQPFLDPAFQVIWKRALEVARQRYP